MLAENLSAGPVLRTERLVLRPHRADDLDQRCAITADPETMRFIGGAAQRREENWARILRYAGHWHLLGFGMFAVEDGKRGDFLGEVGLMHFRRGLGEDFDPCPEAAWMLARSATGRGLATEALGAALEWHEAQFGAARKVCIIAPENEASRRVAVKLGFHVFREGLYHDRPVTLFDRNQPLPKHADRR